MWAQLVKMRVRPENVDRLNTIGEQWEEQVGRGTDSGWIRSLQFKGANNPNELYEIAFFESEEKARASENSPQHRAVLGDLLSHIEGQPDFVDLIPVRESNC